MMLSNATFAVVMEALTNALTDLTQPFDSYTPEQKEQKRTELMTALAELQAAQAAGEWRPVGDGEISSFMYVDNGGKLVGIYAGDDTSDWYATEDLPDNIRLCQRTTIGSQEERDE